MAIVWRLAETHGMNSRWNSHLVTVVGKFVAISVMLSSALGFDGADTAQLRAHNDPEMRIKVFVFNAAGISLRDLVKAEAEASDILSQAGTKVAWVAGLTSPQTIAYTASEPWNAGDLEIRIWTSAMVGRSAISSDVLAYSAPGEHGFAVLLRDRIQNLAVIWHRANDANFLGLVMAHEIGHLLLRTTSHSRAGVMKDRFLITDLAAAERGELTFSPKESKSMQAEVRRRLFTANAHAGP